jgi:GNAT superfamily N-acetyltransferase
VITRHLLGDRLMEAVGGRFPSPDGHVEVLPSPPGRTDAVVAFTAHSLVASPLEPDEVRSRLDPDDLGAPMGAEFLAWMARRLGATAGMLDLVMVAPQPAISEELPRLLPRDDLVEHPRFARSQQYRTGLRCYSDPDDRAVVVLGRGLAERWELAIEVGPDHRGRGLGTALARGAPRLVPDGEPLFAQVSPGNVASIRAFLAAGYQPICSEVLFLKR